MLAFPPSSRRSPRAGLRSPSGTYRRPSPGGQRSTKQPRWPSTRWRPRFPSMLTSARTCLAPARQGDGSGWCRCRRSEWQKPRSTRRCESKRSARQPSPVASTVTCPRSTGFSTSATPQSSNRLKAPLPLSGSGLSSTFGMRPEHDLTERRGSEVERRRVIALHVRMIRRREVGRT